MPAAGELERVAAEAGAGVEHEAARAQAERGEAVEADRQHVDVSTGGPVAAELVDVGRHGQHLAVLLDGHARRSAATSSARAPAGARRRRPGPRSSGSSRPRAIVAAQRLGVAGPARQHGVAVGAGDLGQRAAVGGDERRAGGHRLDGRQAEPLVQARHDGQLGLGVELDDALVGDAGHEVDVVGCSPSDVDQVHALAGLRLADDR